MNVQKNMYSYGASKSKIREIAAYASQRKQEIGVENVFDFSLGNPSVPSPEAVKASILKSLELPSVALHSYTPAQGTLEAREAVAAHLRSHFGEDAATAADLYLTCGAAASVSIALHSVVHPGEEVIVLAPYFPEYKVWIESCGARCVEVLVKQDDFQLDLEAIEAAINQNTRAIIVNSPNNPVGTIYPEQDLKALNELLKAAEKRLGKALHVISDEPYREITYGDPVAWVPACCDRTIVCYSYSKSLSLPGERIGWVLVPPSHPDHDDLIFAIAGSGRALGFVCAPALFQRVLADCVDEEPNIDAYARNRELLCQGLDEAGLEYVEPQGAFYLWVKAQGGDAEAFCERAREFELLPVPSDSFGCPGWVRVSYCVSEETIVNSIAAWKQLGASYKA